jgi:hypothetical protein
VRDCSVAVAKAHVKVINIEKFSHFALPESAFSKANVAGAPCLRVSRYLIEHCGITENAARLAKSPQRAVAVVSTNTPDFTNPKAKASVGV